MTMTSPLEALWETVVVLVSSCVTSIYTTLQPSLASTTTSGKCAVTAAVVLVTLLTAVPLVAFPKPSVPHVKVAMIGNSMMYYNDFPRFMEALSDGHISQNSCLHGNANFQTILQMGNGMFNIWNTGSARIFNFHQGRIHDYGACTVRQLLFGKDDDLDARVRQIYGNELYTSYSTTDDASTNAAAAAASTDDDTDTTATADTDDDNTAAQEAEQSTDDGGGAADDVVATTTYDDAVVTDFQKEYGDDFFNYNDGSNPCLRNPLYYKYLIAYVYSYHQNHHWDYVLLNDNTRSPARAESRQEMLTVLQDTYLPWLVESGATPIFLATYGYWTPYRDMGGLGSVAEFTSLTMAGYQAYVDLLAPQLPSNQQPRIAPVGLAFLMVWEDNRALWERLFHVDQIHCGPLGTYLQGLVVHHAIFGVLPPNQVAVRGDMSVLWLKARRFQPAEHHRDPFPTQAEAAYLYQIALRVTVYKQIPSSFSRYRNGEASDYVPVDDIYKVDDLF